MDENLKTVMQAGRKTLLRYPYIRDDLEDLVEDAFLEMNAKYDELRNRENITAWLIVTLNNKIRERATRTYNELVHIGIYIDDPCSAFHETHSGNSIPPEQTLLAKERSLEIRRRLEAEVGKKTYRLLMAYYVDRIPLDKLAKAEHTTPDALKMRFYRIRRRLKKKRGDFQR